MSGANTRIHSPGKNESVCNVSFAGVSSNDSIFTSSSTLPDFASQHTKYTRGLLKGRHPRSFPKQSELWHHYKASASRLERVVKGHNLWNIIDEEDKFEHQMLSPLSDTESTKTLIRQPSINPDVGTRYIPKSTLHGFHVDTKGVMKMHYGMNIVLMNCSDEVLCVNKFEEVLCKPESLLEDEDEIIFKIVDLTEPTNPGPIEYGKPIWLQSLRSSGDNNIHFGFVLTSKLFGPPEMESAKLTQMPTKMHARRMMSGKIKSRKEHQVFGSSDSNTPTRKNSFGSDMEDFSEGGVGIDSFPSTPIKKNTKNGTKKSDKDKKSSEISEVCGGINIIRAFNSKSDVNLIDTDMTRFRSRQASHLGCWTVQNALKTGVPSNFVQSCTSIYLSQDLYCLATSHGNLYDPWPRTVEVNKVQAQLEKKKEVQKLSRLSGLPFFQETKTEKSKATSSTNSPSSEDGEDSSAPKPRVIPTFTSNIPHACLRRVVERGAPYSHVVDRRCVWKFCVADNPRDLKLLSVKEQKAHKLLRKAKAGLNKSKRNRLGGRVHEGYDINGEPLVGGQKFPRLLRNIVSHESLKLETQDMADRRQKEEAISQHLRSMFEGSPTKSRERNDELEESDEVKDKPIFRKPRAAFARVREKLRKAPIPKHEFDETYNYTFGNEMLQIHQGFAAVNSKVTGGMMKSSLQDVLNRGANEEPSDMLKSEKASHEHEAGTISKKLDLLSLADEKVMLALQYQARLNSKVSIGNLFDDVLDDNM